MRKEIRRLSPLRYGMFSAVAFAFIAILYGLMFMLLGEFLFSAIEQAMRTDPNFQGQFPDLPRGMGAMAGGMIMITGAIGGFIGGFIFGVIGAAIYNLIAMITGGIIFEMADVD